MTEKQKQYILNLEDSLRGILDDFLSYPKPVTYAKDILGEGWIDRYQSISHQDASLCINKLKEEIGIMDDDLEDVASWFATDYEGDAIY